MKTKVFNIWTDLVEEQINHIEDKKEELHHWLDTKGTQMFEVGQGMYFQANRAAFVKDQIRLDLAKEQVVAGFDKVFNELLRDFPDLSDDITLASAIIKQACISDTYLPFIASRAIITGQYARREPTEVVANINFTIESFEFLQKASQCSIDSMKAHLAKMAAMSAPRGASSPVMHRQAPVAPVPELQVKQDDTKRMQR